LIPEVTMGRFSFIARAAAIGALLALSTVAGAADLHWTGAVDDSWQTAGNWDGGVVPLDGHVVYIDAAANPVTLAANTWPVDGLRILGGTEVDTRGHLLLVDEGLMATTRINGADFLLWQTGGSPDPVSSPDLGDWQSNFGLRLPPAGSASSRPVPEPGGLWLGIVAAVVGTAGRRRRGG
jgi:hypothetical protein